MTLEFPERAGEAGRVWDRIASWWDDRIGDGNADRLEEPPFRAESRTGSSWPRGIPRVLVARLVLRSR